MLLKTDLERYSVGKMTITQLRHYINRTRNKPENLHFTNYARQRLKKLRDERKIDGLSEAELRKRLMRAYHQIDGLRGAQTINKQYISNLREDLNNYRRAFENRK